MKQGSGNSSNSAGKIEPRSAAISPAAAGQIGLQTMNTKAEPMSAGRGFSAPGPVSTTLHHCGSQGKHR